MAPEQPEQSANQTRWGRVGELFHQLVALPPNEQAARLAGWEQADPDLVAEVRSLLAADRSGDPLSTPAWVALGEADPDQLAAGARVGPYRILDEVARGGMGVVYRAERADGAFERQVAIKLARPDLLSPALGARFLEERRLLATLDHPGIARLLDAGTTEDGRLYLVLDLVVGERLDAWAQGKTLRQRLDLFLAVCDAVGHAHHRLVLHRDLKPANILVTADGRPKLLDFGIARLLDDVGPGDATRLGGRALTPEYASPEQLRGEPLGTASDVYALGVVLYELLTGRRPHPLPDTTSPEERARRIETEPLTPPSHVVRRAGATAPLIARAVAGELDAIVARALEPLPERRYPSVTALVEDLVSHLDGRPIVARPPSVGARVVKLVRRHRLAVVMGATVALLLLVATAVSLRLAATAARERARAERRFDDLRQLAGALLFELHDEIAPLAGSTPARRVVVDKGLAFLARLEEDARGEPTFLRELAAGYLRIGEILGWDADSNLGDFPAALRAYERARDLLAAARERHQDDDGLSAVWINVQLRIAASPAAATEARGAAVDAALAAAEHWVARAPASIPAREALARAHFQQAIWVGPAGALAHWMAAERLFAALLAEEPDDPNRQRNVALVAKYLGGYYEDAGDRASALVHHRRALALDQQRLTAAPDDRRVLLDVAIDLGSVAHCELDAGNHAAAAAGYEESLAIRQRLSDADPDDVYARARLAYVHRMLATAYLRGGRRALARQQLERAFTLYASLDTSSGRQFDRAEAFVTLGELEGDEGRPLAACAAYRQAWSLLEATPDLRETATGAERRAGLERKVAACEARSGR